MKLFFRIFLVSICIVALLGLLVACDGGDEEPNTSQTDKVDNVTPEVPTDVGTHQTQSPSGNNTAPNVTPDGDATNSPNVPDTPDVPDVPTDTQSPDATDAPTDTSKPDGTTSTPDDTTSAPEVTVKPNWNELPKVDPNVAYTDNSIGYVDGECVTHTNYNSRNMILGARYEIFAHERYYIMTKFTYAENGPLTELYVEVTGEPRLRYVFEYDESGDLKASKFFYLGKEKDSEAFIEYHSNGLVKKVGNEDFVQEFDKLGRLVYESMDEARAYTKFTYSGDSRRPSKVEVVSRYEAYNQELTPVYSADGQVSEIESFYLQSKQRTHYKLEYAANGRISKIDAVATDAEGNVAWRTVLENTYDERSNPTGIVSVTYNADGSVNRKQVYGFVYDDRDNIIEENYEYYVGLALSSSSQEKREYDQNNRCIKEVNFQYDEKGIEAHYEDLYEYYGDTNVLKKETSTIFYIEPAGKPRHLTVHEYYENGRTTMKRISYSYDTEGNITDYHLTENNAEGVTVKQAYVHIHQDGEMFWGGTLYEEEFDANGKTIKITETSYDAEGKINNTEVQTRNYSAEGKLQSTETIRRYSDGTISMKDTHVFDENEKEISSVSEYFKDDGSLDYKNTYEYTYYENGNRKSSTYTNYYGSGAVRRIGISEYDEAGNCIKNNGVEYDEDGRISGKSESSYRYDAEGREIARTMIYYDANGNVKERYESENVFVNGRQVKDITTKYDGSGKIIYIEESRYSEDGEWLGSKTDYYYNGVLSSSEEYEENDTFSRQTLTSYYSSGKVFSVEITEIRRSDDSVVYTYTEYAEDGTVIKNITNPE